MKIPIGISDFKEIIEDDYLFVDKSLFIQEVMRDGAKIILITRPRRFGKTLNLLMLYYFLEQSYGKDKNLFAGLAIAKDVEFCRKHQHRYPVIFISFKDIKQSTYTDAYAGIVELIQQLYGNHRYLLEEDVLHEEERTKFNAILNGVANVSNIQSALKKLSVYMERKFNQSPIMLIDEYDTPIQEAYLKGYYGEMIELMRSMLGQALKDNTSLAKGVLTGITRISQESLFSGLNNVAVYSMLREKYGQYFGFTEEEVLQLIDQSGQPISMSSVKEWYNGYQIGKYVLYNPWSIINCLSNDGKLESYWVNTSSNDLIGTLLSRAKPVVKQQFEALLQGNVIEQPLSENLVLPDIATREGALWSLLLYAGYLKVLSSELRGNRLMARMAIPNKEVGFVYDDIVEQWFEATMSLDSYDKFVQSLASGEMDKFKGYLSDYMMQTGSYFDFHSQSTEQIFHVFILGLVVGLRDHYIIQSNQETGLGRCDVMFIPKKKDTRGIVLEFKTSTTEDGLLDKANEALQQIKDKRYMETLKQHEMNAVLGIGLAFCGKQMEMVYEELRLV